RDGHCRFTPIARLNGAGAVEKVVHKGGKGRSRNVPLFLASVAPKRANSLHLEAVTKGGSLSEARSVHRPTLGPHVAGTFHSHPQGSRAKDADIVARNENIVFKAGGKQVRSSTVGIYIKAQEVTSVLLDDNALLLILLADGGIELHFNVKIDVTNL